MTEKGTYVRADDRRRMVQATTLKMLGEGVPIDDVTLRSVANRADMPLSTVTYVYPARDVLFSDLLDEFFQNTDDSTFDGVGVGGLVEELRIGAEHFYDSVVSSPAMSALLRYAFVERISGRPDPIRDRDRPQALAKWIQIIAERSGETYRLSFDVLGAVCQSQIDGNLLRYFEHRDPDQYLVDVLTSLGVIALAADPKQG